MRKPLLTLPLLLLLTNGCGGYKEPPVGTHPNTGATIERIAYKTVVGAKAFLDSIKKDHPECISSSTDLCNLLRQATFAKDLLIDAGEAFCSGGSFGQPLAACNVPDQTTNAYNIAYDKLSGALNNYKKIETDLRGVVK